MAEPPSVTSIGYLTRIGVAEENPYGTPALATQVLPSISESLNDVYAEIPDESLQGSPVYGTPEQGNFSATGDIVVPMRYANEWVLLKHFFGAFAAGRYDLVDSLQGQGLTISIDKQVLGVWDYSGSKATQIQWTSNADGVILTTSVVPGALQLNSTVNTHAHLVTLLQDSRRLLHHHLQLLVGTQDHALSPTTDDLCCSELTLTMARPYAIDYTNCSQSPMEPIENAFLTFRLAITFPRFRTEEEQIITWRQNYTQLQARLLYTHPTTGQTKTLVIPNLTFVTATAPTAGPGPRVLTTEASITRGAAATTSAQIAIASNVLTLTGGTFPQVAPGGQVTISGAATPANNGTFEATAWTPTSLTLGTPPALTDEAAGATITVSSANPVVYMTET
jgi:hypothetical protein